MFHLSFRERKGVGDIDACHKKWKAVESMMNNEVKKGLSEEEYKKMWDEVEERRSEGLDASLQFSFRSHVHRRNDKFTPIRFDFVSAVRRGSSDSEYLTPQLSEGERE